jgi:hypothetical protein
MQSGALAHHYNVRIPGTGLRLKTCNMHCVFCVLCFLCSVSEYFSSSDRIPLIVLFISCLWLVCSAVLSVAVTYAGGDVSCLHYDTMAIGFFAEGECYGATFHPWS